MSSALAIKCDRQDQCRAHMAALVASAEPCEYRDQHPAIARDIAEHARRLEDLEDALRGDKGVYTTLQRLEIQFVQFTTQVTASVRTTVALGSAGGALLGAIAAALAIAGFFGVRR